MRVLTWSTGCAFSGSAYRRSQERAWQQVAACGPDVALLQEVLRPPSWVPAAEVVFTPYAYADDVGTAVWTPGRAAQRAELDLTWLPSLPPQVTVAEAHLGERPWLVASVHA